VGVALAAQFEGPIDLVVSDVLMPVLGGPGMMRELHKVRPEIPVLFISAYTGDRAFNDDIRETAHSSFLAKPFSQKQLIDAIARVLHGDAASVP
jgi:two-component system cell cycle sensor histidine kinase/response regulator CckA